MVVVDYYNRERIFSASVSVFAVSAESVYPLITVDSVEGEAEVIISFETTLLLVVQAPGYSTVSRSYISYCSTGCDKSLHFA